jgi:hypothetical protein
MSTETSGDLYAYHAYIKTTLSHGGSLDDDASPEAYAEYQSELARLRAELQPAIEQHERGEGEELDLNVLVEQILDARTGS